MKVNWARKIHKEVIPESSEEKLLDFIITKYYYYILAKILSFKIIEHSYLRELSTCLPRI